MQFLVGLSLSWKEKEDGVTHFSLQKVLLTHMGKNFVSHKIHKRRMKANTEYHCADQICVCVAKI